MSEAHYTSKKIILQFCISVVTTISITLSSNKTSWPRFTYKMAIKMEW